MVERKYQRYWEVVHNYRMADPSRQIVLLKGQVYATMVSADPVTKALLSRFYLIEAEKHGIAA